MKQGDKRLHCSDEKRNKIKETITATRNRRGSQIVKCFELKVMWNKLSKKQKDEIQLLFAEGKWFYNHVLNLHRNGVGLRNVDSTGIKEVRHYDKDANELISKLEQLGSQHKQAIVSRMISNEKTIAALISNGCQTHGGLKFKSELNCIPLMQYKNSYVFKGESTVRITGISGKLHLKGTHQLHGVDEFANANLVHKPDGYYLKVTCYINKEDVKPVPCNKKELGLDFGIKTNITTSEGDRIDISVGESEHLKVLQKKLARQVKGSNNRKRTIHQIQITYQKQTNKKKDKCNKFIHSMKAYKVVVMQDEQLANWKKTPGMSAVVQHSCMGMIKTRLKTMSNVIVLENNIPTTKWCPCCGKINELTLNDRRYVCKCGRLLDRDLHAAQNMLHIAHLVCGTENLVPTEHREIKRVEFLNKSRMMKHEADQPLGCR